MALTTERIREIERSHVYNQTATLVDFARAIEAEVRGRDEALIRQLVDALCMPCDRWNGTQARIVNAAIAAARARLEGKP